MRTRSVSSFKSNCGFFLFDVFDCADLEIWMCLERLGKKMVDSCALKA